eukprot:scaffold1442_cov123-Amphora_coffeaeformis.AAC.2
MKRYKSILIAFMRYRDGLEYDRQHEFTPAELSQVTDIDVDRFMKQKVYGTPTPTEEDRPTLGRSSTLYDIKKSLSYYMPNKNHQWNEVTKVGNPTRSALVNETIKRVKKYETRKQGAPSQARRPLSESEFRFIISTLHDTDFTDIIPKYGIPALLCFQFHMIGRLDDSCKFLRENLKQHDIFPSKAAKARLCWGKNVHEERDAPWQHLYGSLDPVFCVMLNLGLWLEIFHSVVPDGRFRDFIFGFVPNADDPEATADRIKSKVYRELRRVMKDLSADQLAGLLGTHSVRKFASTWVRTNGISRDDKDHRGRWKRKRVSDVYDDIELDYIDAKVAAVLCRSGVCHYLSDDDAINDDWMVANVTPHINEVFGRNLAVLFGKPLLWLAYSDRAGIMPPSMLDRIRVAYESIRLRPGIPIIRRMVFVSGEQGTVYMDDVEEQDEQEHPQAEPGPAPIAVPVTPSPTRRNNLAGGSNRQLLLSLLSGQHHLRREVTDLKNFQDEIRVELGSTRRSVNRCIRKIDSNPLRMMHMANQNNDPTSPQRLQVDENCDRNAILAPTVRTLEALWLEYTHGIGGNKAARYFTRVERGRCKFKYSRRKNVWDLVQLLLNRGSCTTHGEACDLIRQAYGQASSITTIIKKIQADRKAQRMPEPLQSALGM